MFFFCPDNFIQLGKKSKEEYNSLRSLLLALLILIYVLSVSPVFDYVSNNQRIGVFCLYKYYPKHMRIGRPVKLEKYYLVSTKEKQLLHNLISCRRKHATDLAYSQRKRLQQSL